MLTQYAQQSMIDALPIGACVFIGPKHSISAVNAYMLSIWNKDSSVIGKNLHDAIPEIHDQGFYELLTDVLKSGKEYRNPLGSALILVDGKMQERFFDFSFKPLRDQQGIIYGIVNTAIDTTERIKAEREAQGYTEELSATNEELTTLNDEYSKLNDELQTANEKIAAMYKEVEVRNRQLNEYGLNLLTENQGLQKDVTRLSNNERFMQQFVEQAPAGMALMRGPNLVYVLYNSHYQSLLPKRELSGRSIFDVLPELIGSPLEDALHNVYQSGKPFVASEQLFSLNDAADNEFNDRYFNFNYLPWYNEQGVIDGILNFAYEVTDQVKARQELQESKSRLQNILDIIGEGIGITDEKGNIVYTNQQAQAIFKLNRSRMLELQNNSPEWHNCKLDGTPLPNEDHPVTKAITTGQPVYGFEFMVQDADQQAIYLRMSATPIKDANNVVTGAIGSFTDITERKADERRKQDFIGIVSHELRSPLTSLNGYVQMLGLKAKQANDPFILNIANKAGRQVERMKTLISGFLDVARLGEGKIQLNLTRFDMAKLFKAAEEESLATTTSHQIIYHPVEYTPVEADMDKIEQVLVNFVNNAVKYSPQGSAINVTCITKDGWAHVSVADEGMGIPFKDQQHVFERFYRVESDRMKTTKGFGIGLYICKEIIERHGGQIGVESVEGNGSAFWFRLPVHQY